MANSRQKPKIPTDFTGKLIYFSGLPEKSAFDVLNNKLLLISEDNKDPDQSYREGSNWVFGFVLNSTLPKRLYKHMHHADQTLTSRFNLSMVVDSAVETFEPEETTFLTFLQRKEQALGLPNETIFGDFAAYMTETAQEAKVIFENHLKNRSDVIFIDSQFSIPREELIHLVEEKYAVLRDADPDIVMNTSAYMRAKLAFPTFVP